MLDCVTRIPWHALIHGLYQMLGVPWRGEGFLGESDVNDIVPLNKFCFFNKTPSMTILLKAIKTKMDI